ncbi:hypothetical protein N0V88_000806 [Collariella sp. IMI 366227]|nr:hypothetical protein N0V88_000806 [Collariella sp. IMI 366227]
MPARRKPKTPSAAAAAATGSTSAPARVSKIYEASAPAPQQLTFPPRQKVVRKYGRRSLPAAFGASAERRRTLRQSTLTQIDYVQASGAPASDGALRFGELEMEGEESEVLGRESEEGEELEKEEEESEPRILRSGRKTRRLSRSAMAEREKKPERRSKSRKTTGDEPAVTPTLQRKGSSFHTQTLTQFLGSSAPKLEDDGLRVEGEEEGDIGLPLPGSEPIPTKKFWSAKGNSKGKAVMAAPLSTPTSKRIKVDPYEVPSSQPTPCTPMLNRYSPPVRSPPLGHGSPLTQKSTKISAPPPTVQTVSRLPRTLVIQDSYSMGSSSEAFPSSAVGNETPTKNQDQTFSQKPRRTPLGDIPVASLELGEETPSQRPPLTELPVSSLAHGIPSTPTGETPTTRRKRLFVEIPDSDDELESVGSTPLRPRSTQQTPLKSILSQRGFQTPSKLRHASGSQPPGRVVAETPGSGASLGRSEKENDSPGIPVFEDGDGEGEELEGEGDPGTPTPTLRRMASQLDRSLGRASQSTARTASQFWAREEEGDGGLGMLSGTMVGSSTRVVQEEMVFDEEDVPGTPTPAPRPAASHGDTTRPDYETSTHQADAADEAEDLTASEAEEEEENAPTSILRKRTSQKVVQIDDSVERNRKSTPGPASESSLSEAPGTPTPNVRRVQIELPPPSTAEDVYKETPQKPSHKNQRIPHEVIRALGPQTDRTDILISLYPDITDDIVNGVRDHEFRAYKFPIQVLRCWIYITSPVQEVKYMAILGPAQEPGQTDPTSGLGNAEFNSGTSGDIIHSTQLMSSERRRQQQREEEEDVILESPFKTRQTESVHPPTRSSQRLRDRNHTQHTQPFQPSEPRHGRQRTPTHIWLWIHVGNALELSDDSDIKMHPSVGKLFFIRAKQNQIRMERQQRKLQIETLKLRQTTPK